jgi:hypothetical protein
MRKSLVLKAEDKTGEVSSVIATLNKKDADGDVTREGFFGEQHVSIVGSHDWHDIMLGKGVLKEEGDRAVFRGKFNLDDPDAAKLHSKVLFDIENPPAKIEWSYNLRLVEGAREAFKNDPEFGDGQWLQPVDGKPGVKVDEVSPVLVGAGVGTGTLGVKARKGETVSILEELAEMGDEDAKQMLSLHRELDQKSDTQRFIDQLGAALEQLESVGKRAEQIREKRPLGVESREKLAHISLNLKDLADRVAVLTVVTDDAALAEFLRYQKQSHEMRS